MSQDLVALGVASANMAPNQPALDSGPLFVQAVNYAQSHGIAMVIADPGAYYFLTEAQPFITAHIDGVSNVTIDFQGADLYFAAVNVGLYFTNCSNLTVQNFTVDHLQPSFTQLRVSSVDPTLRQIQFTVQPGWQNPSALNTLLNNPKVVFSSPAQTDVFIFRNGRLWANYTPMPVQQPFNDNYLTIGPNNFDNSALLASIRPGDIAVLRVRVGTDAVSVSDCLSCTFRDIRIYSGLVGINLSGGNSSSSVLERIYVMPKPGTDRLVSTLADGITLTHPGPHDTVRLSRAIRTLDDGFSPHVWVWGSVLSLINSRTAVITAAGITAMAQYRPLPNLSNVAFERASDGTILATAVVSDQTPITSVSGVNQATVTFDRDLPANVVGAYLYSTDASWRGDGLRLERNTVQEQGFARGVSLWGLMNMTLSGSYLHRTAMTGVHIIHKMGTADWQVPPNVGITLKNNVIDGAPTELDAQANLEVAAVEANAFAPTSLMSTSPNQNLTFNGNFIANAARSAFSVANTTGATLTGNYLLHPNNNPRTDRIGGVFAPEVLKPISILTSANVSNINNPVDLTSGQMWVTDTQYRELAAYAPGTTIRLNAYNLGTRANISFTLTDADGISTAMPIVSATTHAVDVTIPASAGLGGAYVTAVSGTSKLFSTLFVDSQDNNPSLNGCTYELSPSAGTVAATPGTFDILVVTQAGCSYQALDTDSFVTVGGSMTGTGVVSVNFASNPGVARASTIEIAGQPFNVTQSSAVTAVSVTPSYGIGTSQTFSAVYSDSNGFADINTAMLNINNSSSLASACVVRFSLASYQFFLMDDVGSSWIGPVTLGSTTLQNSQCTLNVQTSSFSASANNLTVSYALSFAASFSGAKSVFLNVSNNSALSSGWQAIGTWTVGLKKRGIQQTSQ
jgi:hypothetical protein